MSWSRRFVVNGVFWRHFLRWAVLNVPLWLEPVIMALWALFFMLWRAGRRGVMRNLSVILPKASPVVHFYRAYRVFWNFAWVIADNVRFKEMRVAPDWEFEAYENFEALQSHQGGAILLTAHMGSYDVGAQLFAEISQRHIVMVRAPESDPETRQFEEQMQDRNRPSSLRVDFSTRANELALDLLHALQRGEIIAIQGDRVTPGISVLPATLFGRPTEIPAGPFALAMTARVPVFPLFIVRLGRRRYRLVAGKPFEVPRTRDRAAAFEQAVALWTRELESIVARGWYQWFQFAPFEKDAAA